MSERDASGADVPVCRKQEAKRFTLTLLVSACAALATVLPGCGAGGPRVVLFCAQDKEFAEQVLDDYSKATGVKAYVHYDTEANKSVALYVEIVQEKDRPRCDVFWNNEILSTIRLQRQGLLLPYESPSARPYPANTRPEDKTWQAFASRVRILIVNTKRVSEDECPKSLLDLTKPRWKGKVAMSKPLAGTSATQAACLFDVLGSQAAKDYYQALKKNDVAIVPGNKQVAQGVAAGQFDVGITDTDDAIAELKAGRPVVIVYPDRDGSKEYPRMGTLFIPNTVAIIRNAPDLDAAKKLVDFLLSPEVEEKLAHSESCQIPLNPDVRAKLKLLYVDVTARPMEVKWERAVDEWDNAMTFLRQEFGQ